MSNLRIMVGHFTCNSRNTNRKGQMLSFANGHVWNHRKVGPQSPLDYLSATLQALNTVLRWLLLHATDMTVKAANRHHKRRRSVKKEVVSATTELKCDENLNKTNGGGRKVIRFNLKKCQATAKRVWEETVR